MALPAEVLELRRQLEQRFPDAQPVRYGTTGVVATGLATLDSALPAGGLPRGRVTLWQPGGGATSILRASAAATMAAGERAVWVDGAGQVAGASWEGGPVLFRPKTEHVSACAEELLRSGGFALVVVVWGGGVVPGDGEGVRLARAAREGGSAFVAVAGSAPLSHLRARSSFDPEGFRWKRGPFGELVWLESVVVRVWLESMGLNRRVRVRMPVEHHDVRLSLEPRLVDRRGVRR